MIVVRPLVPDDMRAFFTDQTIFPTVWGHVGVVDGKVECIGGLAQVAGRQVAFYAATETGLRYRLALVKTASRLITRAKASGRRVLYAVIDPAFAGAPRWLVSMGFRPIDEYEAPVSWHEELQTFFPAYNGRNLWIWKAG